MAVFSGLTHTASLRFDDTNHLVRNLPMREVNWDGIFYFWRHPTVGAYSPVTNSIWFLLTHLNVGVSAFYVANLVVYSLSVMAAYFAMQPLIGSLIPLSLATLWFALHPLHVEPVAWLTCLRDLLAGFFSLLSVGAYARYLSQKGNRFWYVAAFVAFLLAVLSKNTAFSLPLVLAAMGVFFFERSFREVFFHFLPWAISLPLLFLHADLHSPIAEALVTPVPWPARILVALDAITFYLAKVALPVNLSFDYGRSPQSLLASQFLFLTPLIPILLGLYFYKKRNERWGRRAMGGLLVFCGSAFMALGLKPFVFQHISTVADRYVFLSLFAPSLVLGIGASRSKRLCLALGVWCLFFAVLTFHEVQVWQDDVALYQRIVVRNSRSWYGYSVLGSYFERAGDKESAVASYQMSIKKMSEPIKRSILCARLGTFFLEERRYADAVGVFTQALSLNPNFDFARENLNLAWSKIKIDHMISPHETMRALGKDKEGM